MSKIEVDAVEPQSGTSLTLGASGDTITIPAGATISNSGTAAGFGPTGAVSWNTTPITADPSPAVSGVGYFADTTSAAFTITLPATPSAGAVVGVSDYANNFATANITVGRNGSNIGGEAYDFTLNTDGLSVTFVYVDATQGWIITDSGLRSDATTTASYSIDFLVVAGGAGGGGDPGNTGSGGGGGAGGFRTSTQPVVLGTVITVTVGDGGAGNRGNGTNGSSSSVSGSGMTTITSAGGGGGAGSSLSNGLDGGSGGGGCEGVTKLGGAGNTPSTSPSQGNNGGNGAAGNAAGGGGGSGAVGGTASSGNAGNGGVGIANTITGSSVYYAGGGGGSCEGGTNGSGGNGGGGAGSSVTGVAGTINTGGGGGGAFQDAVATGGAGGKGVVILSVPTVDYSATSTGSPTITISGANTILKFTGTGSYTA